jgi:cellulose biosynthesis protein BcsQ
MTTSILFGTTKGGTGKSQLTYNTAHGLLRHRPSKKVFIVDLDHQGTLSNLTLKGRYKEEEDRDIGTYLKRLKPLTIDDFTPTDIEGLYLIPNYGNIDSDFFVSQVPKGYQLDAVKVLMQNFNEDGIVLYDMPGSNGNNFLNIIKVVEHVIVPITLTAEDIDPIGEFLEYIEVNKISNPNLKAHGILINKFDKSATAHNQRELQRLKIKTDLPVLDTKINNSVQFPTASGFNLTIFEYLKDNEQNFINFDNLIKEIISKLSL